ncbi:MAG: YbaY family lipoprotein [Planctomycetota bacterium]|nr:YbaY family lipoprotein [Planctomycetota bacterium]
MNKSLLSKATLAALALLVGVSAVGCAKKRPDPMDSVSGVIVKPDYVKLSPAAVVHVRLADVTGGHIKSETVVERTVKPTDDGTIPFTLAFKESQIDKSRKYAVDARIVDKNQVYVIGGKHHPVLTKGNGDTIEMQLADASKF